jgi:hypothetical protein
VKTCAIPLVVEVGDYQMQWWSYFLHLFLIAVAEEVSHPQVLNHKIKFDFFINVSNKKFLLEFISLTNICNDVTKTSGSLYTPMY